MIIGKLDRRIILQTATYAVDAFNSPVPIYGNFKTVWAMIEPVSDGERLLAGQSLAQKCYRFTIRWSSEVSGIDPTGRVVFDGRTYDINGVKELGRRVALEITATARAETP